MTCVLFPPVTCVLSSVMGLRFSFEVSFYSPLENNFFTTSFLFQELEDAKAMLDSQTEVIHLLEQHIQFVRIFMKEVSPNDRYM